MEDFLDELDKYLSVNLTGQQQMGENIHGMFFETDGEVVEEQFKYRDQNIILHPNTEGSDYEYSICISVGTLSRIGRLGE